MTATYRILRDYGAIEGMELEEPQFDTVDEAVKAALAAHHTPFLIVSIIDWEARERETQAVDYRTTWLEEAAPVTDAMAGVINDAAARWETRNREIPKDLQYGGVTLKNAVTNPDGSVTLNPALTCPGCGALEGEPHKADCTVVFSGISG